MKLKRRKFDRTYKNWGTNTSRKESEVEKEEGFLPTTILQPDLNNELLHNKMTSYNILGEEITIFLLMTISLIL